MPFSETHIMQCFQSINQSINQSILCLPQVADSKSSGVDQPWPIPNLLALNLV